MTQSDRGIHPDLLDEELAAQATPDVPPSSTPETPRRGGRRSARTNPSAPSLPTPPEGESGPSTETEPESPSASSATPAESPEWLEQVRALSDPREILGLLTKNLPREELAKDPTLQGWIGGQAEYVARQKLANEQKRAQNEARARALANNDYYTLGELSAPDVQEQMRQQNYHQQLQPWLSELAEFQRTLPDAVQQEIQGKEYASTADYLRQVHDASVRYDRERYAEEVLKQREPALRKAWLSEVNGGAQVPEVEGGAATTGREITDEQIARMSLEESDTYLDERGQPRPGVRVRYTRAINLRDHQR